MRMKISSWIKILPLFILILVFNAAVDAQVAVQRSKNKVVISGVAYYVHQVKKGETAYSIARAYGVSVEELTRENPPAVFGINEGQSLRIPVESVSTVKPADTAVTSKKHDDIKFLYHSLKAGETVYSLSKLFGVSENEIIQSNPGIDINKLPIGAEIAVPKREFMSGQQKFDEQDKRYIYHKVIMGETLSSIARQYGLSVRQLRKENRDIRYPQVGDMIRIPGEKTAKKEEVEQIKPDTIVAPTEELPLKVDHSAGFTEVKDLRGSLEVAVLLPFYLSENAKRIEIDSSKMVKGKRTYKLNKATEDWIFPGSVDFLEMYEGILMAADTLRTLGLNVNLHTYDVKSDSLETIELIRSGKLADMDLIIGPVYSNSLSIVSEYAGRLGIPVVSPVPLMNNTALDNSPTLFMANASLEVSQKALSKKVSEFYDRNIIFVHTDTTNSDEDVKRFKSLIFKELNYKLPYEDIKFKEFLFYSRSMFNNDSINRLSHALSDQTGNIVVIASEDPSVISEVVDNVNSLVRKFDVKLFGYPVIRDLDRLDQKELFDTELMVFYPFRIDYTKKNVKQFNTDFRRKFNTQPLEKSYAWQGFDIAYYFLSGLAINGKKFIEHPEIHFPDLLQSNYDFRRKDAGAGFENQQLYMVRYTKDYEVVFEQISDSSK